ncbi:MAG: calcium-binding protein, partial [Planctomycetota bacterium]
DADAIDFTGNYQIDVTGGLDNANAAGVLSGDGAVLLDIDAQFAPAASDSPINLGVDAQSEISYDTMIQFNADGTTEYENNVVNVSMRDVTLDMGDLYDDFIDPMVAEVQSNLRPIKPVIDLLTAPLPIVSDLAELADKGPISAISSAQQSVQKTVRAIDAILEYQGLSDAERGPQTLFSFEVQKSGVDPQTAANHDEAIRKNLDKVREDGLTLQLNDQHKPGGYEAWSKSQSWDTQFGGSFHVPILSDPDTLAMMLLGDDQAEFFSFDFIADLSMNVDLRFPIAPLLNMAALNAGIGFSGQLNIGGGYDASGLQRLADAVDFSSRAALNDSINANSDLLLQGLYLDDHNADAGTHREGHAGDEAELTLTTTLHGGVEAALDMVLLQASIGGQLLLGGTISMDLNDLPDPESWDGGTAIWSNVQPGQSTDADWQYDGRLRLHELSTIVDADPMAIMNTSGRLDAKLNATVSFGVLGVEVFRDEFNIAEFAILEGPLSVAADGDTIYANSPQLGGVDDDGMLVLFAGNSSSQRQNAGNNTQSDEHFVIRSLGATRGSSESDPRESLMVSFTQNGKTYTQFFDDVSGIRVDTGNGDDVLQILSGVTTPVMISGGTGNDFLTYLGGGTALIHGDEGDDRIQTGAGDDLLYGGDGDDWVHAGGGKDLIVGGLGGDTLIGGVGDDTMFGDFNEQSEIPASAVVDDTLIGGLGDDILHGNAGADVLRGGTGSDQVFGGAGDDRIQMEVALIDTSIDAVHGNAGVDTL